MPEAAETADSGEFQAFLDAVADAIGARDFEAFSRLVALPLVMITAKGTEVVSGADDLREAFEGYLAAVAGHGVTDHVRLLLSTTRVSPTLASFTYRTQLLRDGARAVEPFHTAVTLRRDDGVWRATSFMLSFTPERWRFRLPGPAGDAPA